jgi:hypothetical protein
MRAGWESANARRSCCNFEQICKLVLLKCIPDVPRPATGPNKHAVTTGSIERMHRSANTDN